MAALFARLEQYCIDSPSLIIRLARADRNELPFYFKS